MIASDILYLKDGNEVITITFYFLASTSCIARHDGKPVFVDIYEETFSINVNKIQEKITDKTVEILPIHFFNQMGDMDKIMCLADKYNLKVLEDAAEVFEMRWKGSEEDFRHLGTIGDNSIYSFSPTKTFNCYGDGGMIVSNDE